MKFTLSLLVFAFVQTAYAVSATGNRLLVVLENSADQTKYSQFWDDLQSRGFSVTYETPQNEKLSLFHLGERAYDHVVLFSSKAKSIGPNMTPKNFLEFMQKEGNVLLALNGEQATSLAITSLLGELDIQIPSDRNSIVVDHFNYDKVSAAEAHDVLVIPSIRPYRSDTKDYFSTASPLLIPRAVAQVLGNASPHLAPVIPAPATAYTYNAKDETTAAEDPFAVGSQMSLVSVFQARNSARFTVLGSTEMLQDKWFSAQASGQSKKDKCGNREFAKKISAWTFHETGVLKVGRLQHYLNEGASKGKINESSIGQSQLNPKIYRVKNDVTYSIELSEYSYGQLQPFTLPSGDQLQVEFAMLSPFHRLPLSPVPRSSQPSPANSTLFTSSFTIPDQHGIFNFRVNYKRPFFTNIDEKRTVTVRHFAHDEWPRSYVISGAYVWIAGIAVTVIGWMGFVGIWLYSEPANNQQFKKKQ